MTKETFDIEIIKKELRIHAKALQIPPGAANIFIDQTIIGIKKTLSHKKVITNRDLSRAIIKELKKYNQDFAYVYENHDKII